VPAILSSVQLRRCMEFQRDENALLIFTAAIAALLAPVPATFWESAKEPRLLTTGTEASMTPRLGAMRRLSIAGKCVSPYKHRAALRAAFVKTRRFHEPTKPRSKTRHPSALLGFAEMVASALRRATEAH
jgi:hypothetical protein